MFNLANSAATYSAALRCSGLPVLRPFISSLASASTYDHQRLPSGTAAAYSAAAAMTAKVTQRARFISSPSLSSTPHASPICRARDSGVLRINPPTRAKEDWGLMGDPASYHLRRPFTEFRQAVCFHTHLPVREFHYARLGALCSVELSRSAAVVWLVRTPTFLRLKGGGMANESPP